MDNTKKLSGKVALVTGGSRGIGAAICKRLALDGADVALTYVSAASSAEAVVADIGRSGGRGFSLQVDQGDGAAVASLVRSVYERYGRLDILVLNAGLSIGGMVGDPDADTSQQI